MDNTVNGVVSHNNSSRKDDFLYRISVNAIIRNSSKEVLVVKESGRSWWGLPGGGMDHGETTDQALAREMAEEINLSGGFSSKVIAIEDPTFLEHANIWQIRVVFEVEIDSKNFSPGTDGDEVEFVNPREFKKSDNYCERKIYEHSKLLA